jgi:hypothetical protein
MRKFFTLLSIICVVSVTTVYSKPVTANRALKVAKKAIGKELLLRSTGTDADFKLVYTSFGEESEASEASASNKSTGQALYYVYAQADEGFVIVSADDTFSPVIAVSDNGKFDPSNHSPAYLYWMGLVEKAIRKAIAENYRSEELIGDWAAYESENSLPTKAAASVSALITTQWDQNAPYNQNCPNDGSYKSATGCVATAMAQVMKYHNWPTTGTGNSSAYVTPTRNINVPAVYFSQTTYDWSNMPSKCTTSSSTSAKNAVGTLMYHCGVSVKMDYGRNESSASTLDVSKALVNYFDYDASLQVYFRDNYSDENWKNILKEEFTAQRPVMYRGISPDGGHSFICDGYNTYDQFHFNFGWGGFDDGYFVINGIDFNEGNYILGNIKKDAGGKAQPILLVANDQPFECVRKSATSINVKARVKNYGLGAFTNLTQLAFFTPSKQSISV